MSRILVNENIIANGVAVPPSFDTPMSNVGLNVQKIRPLFGGLEYVKFASLDFWFHSSMEVLSSF